MRAFNNHRAWKIWQKFEVFILKKPRKNIFFQFFILKLINVGPTFILESRVFRKLILHLFLFPGDTYADLHSHYICNMLVSYPHIQCVTRIWYCEKMSYEQSKMYNSCRFRVSKVVADHDDFLSQSRYICKWVIHYLQLKLLSGKNARAWDSMDFT